MWRRAGNHRGQKSLIFKGPSPQSPLYSKTGKKVFKKTIVPGAWEEKRGDYFRLIALGQNNIWSKNISYTVPPEKKALENTLLT